MQMESLHQDETIVALATAYGVGAVGMVRLSGKGSIAIANKVFRGPDLSAVQSHTVHYGHIHNKDKVIDEVMVTVFKAPRTYTREDIVEIGCHGSTFIQDQLIRVLIDQGARLATQGEFTLRAFLNGRIDLSQAEAVNDLIHSENEMSRDIALGQMKGGFKDQISALRQQLIKFASLVELELDFSEEDVEFADRSQLEDLILSTVKVLTGLIQSFEFGNVVRNGVPTAIVGRPNAGKSTLLNALLNEERAIVSQIEGTTRDTIEETMTLNGITFRFIDTAGIRQGEDEIEVIGIEKTFEKIREAKLVVYLFDAAIMDSEELQKDIDDLAIDQQHLIIVANKTDKEGAENWAKDFDAYNTIGISAKEKAQIEDLQKQLVDLVLSEQIDTSTTIITNSRHYQALSEAKHALEDVLNAMHAGLTGDLLAIDIRKSLHALGNITGEISTDDLLDSIFRDFCIGK